MANREGEEAAERDIELPILELTEIELEDGQWCVISADPAKPLTEEQAQKVSLGYQAVAGMLARK